LREVTRYMTRPRFEANSNDRRRAMKVTLEVEDGPAAGKTMDVLGGQIRNVGRTGWADLALPHDRLLSGLHFALECDNESCRLRDLNSDTGTFLNGVTVREAKLHHGDRIVAGDITFRVRIEGVAEAGSSPIPSASRVKQPGSNPASVPVDVVSVLRRQQSLYALLDAARDPRVLELLRASGEEYQSLYEGFQGELLDAYAPHIVKLSPESVLISTLANEAWGKSWATFLACPQSLNDVRKHFRRFLLVRTTGGEELYFRFYDPRVLRVFLPTCTAEEVREVFGPVTCYLMEGETADVLIRFEIGKNGMAQEWLAVTHAK
jgi:pSer/pThr/pTyr-binding forkhead associated (FHA) protein